MAQDIKQKIVLEGEKEYNAAIKEAQRNLKTLRSELKAESAELGKNATAQQKAEVKTKSLQKQIAEQEKIVKANKAALEEVREKYGDNAEVVAKWEQKLNESRAALANMKNSLDEVGNSFKKVDSDANMGIVATKSFADSLQSVGDAAGGIAGALENAFTGVLDVIRGAVSDLWSDMMGIAAKADNYLDLSEFLGATPAEVQKWDRAMKAVGGDMSTITNMITRMRSGGQDNLIAEWFGVRGENYKDDLQYVQAVLDSMSQKKAGMVESGTWAKAMGEIFGAKKVQDIDGILSDWSDILVALGQFDTEEGGVGISDEDLQTMGQLYNQVGLLQEKWNAFKESAESKIFGQLALDLTGNAQGVLDGLIAFMGADNDADREKAIQQIEDNMTAFFTRLGEAIEEAAKALDKVGGDLADSDNGYVAMIGKALQALSDVLEWMTKPESVDQIKKFFETLFVVWTGAKVTRAIANILSFVGNLKLLGMFGATSTAASAAAAGTTAGASWGAAFGSAIMKASPFLAFLYTLLKPGEGAGTNWDQLYDEETGLLTDAGKEAGLIDETVDLNSAEGRKAQAVESGLVTAFQYDYLQDLWDAYRTLRNGGNVPGWDELFKNTEKMFGNDELFKDFMTMFQEFIDTEEGKNAEDLPLNWFTPQDTWNNNDSGGLSTSDINKFGAIPGQMLTAVRSGVSGIKVTMDGQTVGTLVAPYVSEIIARDAV